MQNLHPVFVHFPIALLSVAALLEIAGRLLKKDKLRDAAFWCLSIGVVFAAVAVFSGLRAEDSVAHVEASHELMETHERFGIISLALFALLWLWRRMRSASWSEGESWGYAIAGLVATGVLLFGANQGGKLVYDYGVGTAMTAGEGGDHDHEHEGEDHDDGDDHAAEDGSASGDAMDMDHSADTDHADVDLNKGRFVFNYTNMRDAACHAMSDNLIMGTCSDTDIAAFFDAWQEQAGDIDRESLADANIDFGAGAGSVTVDIVNMHEFPCHMMPNAVIMGTCSGEEVAALIQEHLAKEGDGEANEDMDMGDMDMDGMDSEEGDAEGSEEGMSDEDADDAMAGMAGGDSEEDGEASDADVDVTAGLIAIDITNLRDSPCHTRPVNTIIGDCSAEEIAKLVDELLADMQPVDRDSLEGITIWAGEGMISYDLVNMHTAPCHTMPQEIIMGTCTGAEVAEQVQAIMDSMADDDSHSDDGHDH